MNNMRRGFTMIELIFVIVIIGILAAVAVPKLASTSEEAKKAKVTAFVGTLNRTVGPTMYAKSLASGNGGKIASIAGKYCGDFATYMDAIPEVTLGGDCKLSVVGTEISVSPTDNNFTDGDKIKSPVWKFKW